MNNKEKTHTEGDNPYNDLAKFLQVTQQSQPQLHSQMPAHPELLHHLLLNTQQNPQALAALLQQQKQQQQQQQQALAMPQYLGLSGQPFMQYLGMPGLGGNPEQQKLIGFAGIPHSGNGVDNSVLLNTLLTQQQQQQQQQQAMFQQANKGGFAGGNAVNPFGGNNLFPSPQQLFQQQAPSSSGSGIGSFVPSDNFTQLKEQQQQLQLLQKFEQQQQLQQLQQQFQLSQQQQQQQQKQLISSQQQQQAQAQQQQQQQQLLLIQQQLQQSQQLQDSNGSVQQNGIFINEAYLAQQKALQAQLLYQQQQNQQQAAAGAVGVANNLDNVKSSQKITIEDDEDNNEKDEQPRDISGQIQQNQTHVLYNQQSKISTTHVSGGQSSQQQQQIIEVEESSIPDQFPFLNSKNAIIPSKKDSRNIKSSPQKQNQNYSDSDLQEDNQSGQQIQQQSKKERRENPEISFSEGNSPQKGLKRGKKNEINSQMQLKRASGKNEQANVNEDSEDEGDEQSEEGESQGNHMSSKQDAKHKRKSKEGSNLLEESKNNSSKKTCSNLFCRNNPYPLKPVNSKRHEGKVYWFCPQCLECYNKGFHCDYCEQVYENNESCADVKEWVGCERCFKWNHVDCEAAFRNDNKIKKIYKSKDFKYYCLKCETKRNKKSTNGVQTTSESPQKIFKGSVMNGQQQIAQVGQTNTVFSKKTRGNGNNLLNSNQKQSEDSHITDGKQSIEKRKALTPSRRRLQNASTSQVPSENDKNSVDFKPPRNFQNNDSKSDGDSNYYDISIPYKKRKETQNGKGANHLEETYQLFKKKYHMVYPHPSFNFLQYHLHELSFGVKLSLNEETIRGDLDRLRCCVDEEFKAKYDEEMRIKEEHKKKKEEQDLERQKLIQQRKLLQQQRLKMREEQENDGEDNVNGENNSGDAEDDEEEDDEDIENQSQQQQQPEETESRVRRYATRRHQDLLENKHKKDHNNNGNDNDQLSGDYHGQKLRDGSQERRIGRKITRNNKRNVPNSSNNHNKYDDSGNNDNNNQKQQSEQKKLENGNQKKYENSKTDENKQKDDETKQSMISEGNLSNKEEVLQKQQQQQISDQSEAQSRQNGKESEDVNGKIDEIGRSTRSTRGGWQHEQNSSLSTVSSGVRSTRNNQASQQTKS